MKKKSIIIIDVFLNSDYKINVFRKTLESVKKLDLPIMVISNYKIPQDFFEQIDYLIYSKDNILFENKYDRYPYVNFFMYCDYINYENHNNCYQKHGLSVIRNLNICANYAKNIGFEQFIRIEWDFIVSNENLLDLINLIDNYFNNKLKGLFIHNPSNGSGLPDLCYHFWISNLDFWIENFPHIYNEDQYKDYIFSKNKEYFFETAERILYLSLFDKLLENEIIKEGEFYKLFAKSQINAIVNDINFDLPSGNGVCRGLAKVKRNGNETGELALVTWNRLNENIQSNTYEVIFHNLNKIYRHEVDKLCWSYSLVDEFSEIKYPITLKVDNFFEKTYFTKEEIHSTIEIK